MAEDPHCWYCGVDLIDYRLADGETPPPNHATIEHLISKTLVVAKALDRRSHHIGPKVLACYECNYARGLWDVQLNNMVRNEYWQAWRVRNGYPAEHETKAGGQARRKVVVKKWQ